MSDNWFTKAKMRRDVDDSEVAEELARLTELRLQLRDASERFYHLLHEHHSEREVKNDNAAR
jgi:hypothetical protein